MSESASPIVRFLRRRSHPSLLDRWVDEVGLAGGTPVESLYGPVFRHARDHPDQAARFVEKMIEATAGRLDRVETARLRRLLAHVRSALGQVDQAHTDYRHADDLFRRARATAERGRTAIGWVNCLSLMGRLAEARRLARSAQRWLPPEDRLSRGRLRANLANALYRQGEFAEAARGYRAARQRFLDVDYAADAALCAFNLANCQVREARLDLARPLYHEALAAYRGRGFTSNVLHVRYALATLDLMEGAWDQGNQALEDIAAAATALGDRRLLAAIQRELAGFLAALGDHARAEVAASVALSHFDALGLRDEAAHTRHLRALCLIEMGRSPEAAQQLAVAARYWWANRHRFAFRRGELERARIAMERGDLATARRRAQAAQALLDRRDPRGLGAECRALRAELHLRAGRWGLAARMARRAHVAATGYPSRLERPWMAFLVARARAGGRDLTAARRWLKRAVDGWEDGLLSLGTRSLRSGLAHSRRRLYVDATRCALEWGGPWGPERALDLLSRSHSLTLLEEMQPGARAVRPGLREAMARLRDELLTLRDPQGERGVSLRRQAARLQRDLDRQTRRTRTGVARALTQAAPSTWRRHLRGRSLIYTYRDTNLDGGGWHALVVPPRGRVRAVALPGLDDALARHWRPIQLRLASLAAVDGARRPRRLDRTRASTEAGLRALHDAFWSPLELTTREAVVVPTAELNSVPLESLPTLAPGRGVIASRLPHPALLGPESRRPRGSVVLGAGPGVEAEVERVLTHLGDAVAIRSRAELLAHPHPLRALHIAAHGVIHPEGWARSGLQLPDGWLGFEHLDPARLRGSLLYLSSCDSGLSAVGPGAELENWTSSALRSGCSEVVLVLWKLDDAGATALAGAFHAAWSDGQTAARAADRARRALAATEHPFRWAPLCVVSR